MVISIRHRDQNTEKLKNFQEEITRKYGLNFGYVVSCPILAQINTVPSLVKEAKSGLKSPRKKTYVGPIDTTPTLVKEATPGLISPRKKTGDSEIDNTPSLVKEAMSGLKSPRRRRGNSGSKSKSVQKESDVMQTKECGKNSNEPVANSSTHQNLSTDQAMKKLKRKLSLVKGNKMAKIWSY